MRAHPTKSLRVVLPVLLVLLVVQFEFGMAVNLAGPPSLAPLPLSLSRVAAALSQAGSVAWTHALLGGILVLFSLAALFISLASGKRSLQLVGSLAFVTTVLAAATGLLFVLSGFQNDGDSHGMATNFILAFSFCFIEMYLLKPADKSGGREGD